MADPAELEVFREASQYQMQCSDYLAVAETLQTRRWELLRRVIEDAGKQFTSMRIDVVEERLQEEGSPIWFSVALTIFVAAFPLSNLTEVFFKRLTGATEKLLLGAERKALARAENLIDEGRELDFGRWGQALRIRADLPQQIKRTEERIAKFAELYEPEVHHALVSMAHTLGEAAHKHMFEQRGSEMSLNTDAPIVIVTQSMHNQIDGIVRVEDVARTKLRADVRDLFDVATAKDPAKEARAKELAAAEREAKREPAVPKRQSIERLPTKRKEALQELSSMRDELEKRASAGTITADADALRALQLQIESIMWATTYDFTPRKPDSRLENPYPPHLPEALWKRLIRRYIDPDEGGKSYEEVGATKRLGTVAQPFSTGRPVFDYSPELRLSHYLSQILLPAVRKENNEVVQRFRSL
jgi:hypothetical protein